MVKIKKNAVFFLSGGIGYGIIELLWRGRTHITMILAAVYVLLSSQKSQRNTKRKGFVTKRFFARRELLLLN